MPDTPRSSSGKYGSNDLESKIREIERKHKVIKEKLQISGNQLAQTKSGEYHVVSTPNTRRMEDLIQKMRDADIKGQTDLTNHQKNYLEKLDELLKNARASAILKQNPQFVQQQPIPQQQIPMQNPQCFKICQARQLRVNPKTSFEIQETSERSLRKGNAVAYLDSRMPSDGCGRFRKEHFGKKESKKGCTNKEPLEEDLNSGKFSLKAGALKKQPLKKQPVPKKQPLAKTTLLKKGKPIDDLPSKPISFKAVKPQFTAKLKSARPGQSVHSDWAASEREANSHINEYGDMHVIVKRGARKSRKEKAARNRRQEKSKAGKIQLTWDDFNFFGFHPRGTSKSSTSTKLESSTTAAPSATSLTAKQQSGRIPMMNFMSMMRRPTIADIEIDDGVFETTTQSIESVILRIPQKQLKLNRLGNGQVSSNLISRTKGFGNVFGKSMATDGGNRFRNIQAQPPLKIGQVTGAPSWAQRASRIATTRRTTTTTAYNMCLNGGTYHLGLGCLCVGNFGGDFCDECLPDWIGSNCDTPKEDICSIKGPEVDCSSKWIFNLTLLHLPESTQKLDMAYNGLIKSGAFRRKISTLTKLDDICLRGNYIARFPFKMFDNQPSLKKLDISSNFVFALPPDMFEKSAELFDICFRHNNIKTLSKTIFEKNYKLSIVDMSNNNLSGICKGIFAFQQQLQFVAFNKNEELPKPLNKWFGECPYSREECDANFPSDQYGGPLVNLRRRIGAFGENCE
ncbi:Oidioi.mRNA.OKI2018_I69.XSR.g15392.t2.cds [Oikopleura dioica]|uniref:Oidioi.mRNA.OKI2018_I69.XSR.g15392.t2.cds n=1 Tax=Oikopleura dioica TaxID=34765 RepID=A0ABN7SK56_OIKDI|nr:Oidioi.mRNA.OKI2018_I69.XSR.g15392.t2.cds [Oikopleura dioica]